MESKDDIIEIKTYEDEMCASIREIPFRMLAKKKAIEENFFIEKIYNDVRFKEFFLSNNCEKLFSEVGKLLLKFSLQQVQSECFE